MNQKKKMQWLERFIFDMTVIVAKFVLLRKRRLRHGVRRSRRRTGQASVSMPHREWPLRGRADPWIPTKFPDTGSRLAAGCW